MKDYVIFIQKINLLLNMGNTNCSMFTITSMVNVFTIQCDLFDN